MKPTDETFPSAREAYYAHDQECISLQFMWLPRHGGVTALDAIEDCTDCGDTFYYEGVSWVNWEAPDEDDEIRVCGCCALKRGTKLVWGEYGVTPVE